MNRYIHPVRVTLIDDIEEFRFRIVDEVSAVPPGLAERTDPEDILASGQYRRNHCGAPQSERLAQDEISVSFQMLADHAIRSNAIFDVSSAVARFPEISIDEVTLGSIVSPSNVLFLSFGRQNETLIDDEHDIYIEGAYVFSENGPEKSDFEIWFVVNDPKFADALTVQFGRTLSRIATSACVRLQGVKSIGQQGFAVETIGHLLAGRDEVVEEALGIVTKTLLYLSDDPDIELGFYPGAWENLTEEALEGGAEHLIQLEEMGYPRINFLGRNIDHINSLSSPNQTHRPCVARRLRSSSRCRSASERPKTRSGSMWQAP